LEKGDRGGFNGISTTASPFGKGGQRGIL